MELKNTTSEMKNSLEKYNMTNRQKTDSELEDSSVGITSLSGTKEKERIKIEKASEISRIPSIMPAYI